MRIALGSDHGGYQLKQDVMSLLEELGLGYHDFGTFSADSVDYPDIAAVVARAVASGQYELGMLFCGTGIGMSIAANKIPGIRAAVCNDVFSAKASREHNDANLLCLGERVIGRGHAREIVKAWLGARFAGGRHARRVQKIASLENERGEFRDGSR